MAENLRIFGSGPVESVQDAGRRLSPTARVAFLALALALVVAREGVALGRGGADPGRKAPMSPC
ncbi:hypothetical protein AQI70_30895 [Streptomyces curacoi]|uniref:Uncharacterized protein n=1 Tax=Streptomyces curacoi TaxID=146536 RepID=A0A117NZ23_9ACTN|nr:hypothetical protein AQI70_30895 [Streptomyces curacoi]